MFAGPTSRLLRKSRTIHPGTGQSQNSGGNRASSTADLAAAATDPRASPDRGHHRPPWLLSAQRQADGVRDVPFRQSVALQQFLVGVGGSAELVVDGDLHEGQVDLADDQRCDGAT